ncbi:low temperature requirement protein A [Paracoccus sp. (in: a-proteobacteria)]|uniref:low temperature requirement protein A n=1 Tax=Paracoccus sp. TaxID=267 RepID=UPI003A87A811
MSLPILKARDPDQSHRAATQLELFFDLVSVIAIATITGSLHHAISEGHGYEVFPRFAFVFFAIWWVWMNFTWFASAFDNDGPVYRLLVMVIMGGELLFAGGVGYILETLDFRWGLVGWIVMRLAMILLWLRAAGNAEYRTTALRYALGIALAQACWVAMYIAVMQGGHNFFVWGILVFALELAVPVYAESSRGTPFHRHHMIERYGLLTIISLGEIVLAVSLGFGALFGEHPEFAALGTSVASLVIVFAAFWIYFAEEDHLVSTDLSVALLWGYGHVFVFGALAVLGAGVAAEVDLATHAAHGSTTATVAWWLGGPLATFWIALTLIRDRHFSLGWRGLALPVMALVALAAAWTGATTYVFALISVIAVLWRVPMRLC